MTKRHLFYDGYGLNQDDLASSEFVAGLLNDVKREIFDGEGNITLIPYFNGKVKMDGGVSGVILGKDFHFTCHTFCYKGTVFVDYYGDDNKKDQMLDMLLATFKTDDYDLGTSDAPGNFGKHVVFSAAPLGLDEAKEKVNSILQSIEMTSISDLLVDAIDDDNFDILQPIAESHISLHQHNGVLNVDVFSCKFFDKEKLLALFDGCEGAEEVNRGLRYK